MRTDPRADEVRGIVERVFARYLQKRPLRPSGLRLVTGDDWQAASPCYEDDFDPVPAEIDETIVIDRGRYVARSYRTQGYLAMWLVAVGIVQFYDPRGRMLATVNLFESLRPQRMAA